MPLYKVEFGPNMSLCRAVGMRDAELYMLAELGKMHRPITVSLATKEDREWGEGMGAFIHETDLHYQKEKI